MWKPDTIADDCALRDGLLGGEPSGPSLVALIDALCASDRPEAIFVWKRSPKVQHLIRGLGEGRVPVSRPVRGAREIATLLRFSKEYGNTLANAPSGHIEDDILQIDQRVDSIANPGKSCAFVKSL